MAVTKADVLEFIANLSVMELAELVKEFEEKFGVSAQPVVMAGGGAAAAPVAEEKTEFDVILASSGDKKINVIKALREITGLGLAEAKKASEETPYTVKTGIAKAEAEEIKKKLEEQGAKVEVK